MAQNVSEGALGLFLFLEQDSPESQQSSWEMWEDGCQSKTLMSGVSRKILQLTSSDTRNISRISILLGIN